LHEKDLMFSTRTFCKHQRESKGVLTSFSAKLNNLLRKLANYKDFSAPESFVTEVLKITLHEKVKVSWRILHQNSFVLKYEFCWQRNTHTNKKSLDEFCCKIILKNITKKIGVWDEFGCKICRHNKYCFQSFDAEFFSKKHLIKSQTTGTSLN